MMIKLVPFRGMIPRIADRLLPDVNATLAKNCDLRSGEVEPFHQSSLVESIGLAWGTLFRWYDAGNTPYWLRFPEGVDVVRGPVADDVWERIYWTGDSRFNEPRMSYSGPIQTGGTDYPVASYKMGVPAPENPVTAALYPVTDIAISDIHRERPIRVTTSADHGLRTGDRVEFDITSAAPASGESSLADLLNSTQYQIRSTGAQEFTLDYTDAANVDYSAFTAGTANQYEDPGLVVSRFYVHTYVNNIGEEGPPSPVSEELELLSGQKVLLTLPGLDVSAGQGRIIDRVRIYRTVTGFSSSEFRFVAEIPIAQLTADDELLDTDLGEVMQSTAWDIPNADMKGLRVTAQGVGVGFYDNVLCFSEPYRLHAWPTDYQLAMQDAIVAIEIADNGVVVTTTGRPYLVQGVDPRGMIPNRLRQNYACVSPQSIASLGSACVYASAEGLVLVAGGASRLLTDSLLTEKDWAAFRPESIHGYIHQERYIGFYDDGAGTKGGFIIDLGNPEHGLVLLDAYGVAGFVDPQQEYLYLLSDSGDVLRWDDPSEAATGWLWRSKAMATKPANMCVARVDASAYPVTFRLYADGLLKHEKTVASRREFRLPSGYQAREWLFEVEGDTQLQAIFVADSTDEIDA